MHRFVLKRIAASIPVLLGLTAVCFFMLYLAPGDPAEIILRSQGVEPTPQVKRAFMEQHGLLRSPPAQYVRWLHGIAHGDLGVSFRTAEPVLDEFFSRFGSTALLAAAAFVLSASLAVPLGVLSAVRPGSFLDHACRAAALLGVSVPSFGLGFVLILVFGVVLGWLPVFGRGTFSHLVLPCLTMAAALAPSVMRLTRATMMDTLKQDFIRTARSKGLPETSVVVKHAGRPAANPVVTQVLLQAGYLMGGAVVIETVFAWPGVGKFLADGIFARDYPVIQGFTLILASIFVFINAVSDVLYTWLDPRIRLGSG